MNTELRCIVINMRRRFLLTVIVCKCKVYFVFRFVMGQSNINRMKKLKQNCYPPRLFVTYLLSLNVKLSYWERSIKGFGGGKCRYVRYFPTFGREWAPWLKESWRWSRGTAKFASCDHASAHTAWCLFAASRTDVTKPFYLFLPIRFAELSYVTTNSSQLPFYRGNWRKYF